MKIAFVITALVAGLVAVYSVVRGYEGPDYEAVMAAEGYEIRRYNPYLVAQTQVAGGFKEAGNAAFGILAGYIFGKNVPQEKMAMTSPVVSRKVASGERMAMTIPVISSLAAEAGGPEEEYLYQFVMEREYTLQTLPEPVDDRVNLRRVPARWLAARSFSGRWTEQNMDRHSEALLDALRQDGIAIRGKPALARYNGPMTPPFLRRNEVLVEIASPDAAAEGPAPGH